MTDKIKVGAVSYLNTKPLLYGIERSDVMQEMELLLDYPAQLAQKLKDGIIDIALLPVAAMKTIEGARIVSNYGIAADGDVASVAIFSQVPLNEVEQVILDYQSRTSVMLARILLDKHWKKSVDFIQADKNFIDKIEGKTAAVIIGDRALEQRNQFPYVYDLAQAWKDFSGLPFVFAAWIANKDLPDDFIHKFNKANAVGLVHIDEIVAENPYPFFDLKQYYTKHIHYHLDKDKLQGLAMFLQMID